MNNLGGQANFTNLRYTSTMNIDQQTDMPQKPITNMTERPIYKQSTSQ